MDNLVIKESGILSREPFVHETCQMHQVELGIYTEVGLYNFYENVSLGDFSYSGQFCFIQNAEIGKFVNIAAMVRIGPTDHPMERPTLHHFTYRRTKYGFATEDDEAFFQRRTARRTFIGHDTWIGHGAIIMPSVTIGHGAIVGSGAIVTRDVEPYTIVVGTPAQPIRKRFSEEIIQKLEEIQWWDWSYELIKERYLDFTLPIEEFIAKYESRR
ncbi:MAG: chloramphenicol acetyltransferase [Desulfitobacterium sp.]